MNQVLPGFGKTISRSQLRRGRNEFILYNIRQIVYFEKMFVHDVISNKANMKSAIRTYRYKPKHIFLYRTKLARKPLTTSFELP